MFKKIICITLAFYLYASIYEKSVNTQTVPPDECPTDRLTLMTQDQRAYIAVSVEAGMDLVTVKRTLSKVLGKNVYSERRIGAHYQEFKERKRLTTYRRPTRRYEFLFRV